MTLQYPWSETQTSTQLVPETLPRGISPEKLLVQVKNTAPFIFSDERLAVLPYVQFLEKFESAPDLVLSHAEYFKLCVSAHYATVATFVPTDVDNQIRFKLWHPRLEHEDIEQMVNWVSDARKFNVRPITTRFAERPSTGEIVSGHDGEWFSIAVAAYGATRRKLPEIAAGMLQKIERELIREAEIFLELKAERLGLELLKASTLIAHNLGDLFRVIEMWNLPESDPLHALYLQALSKSFCDGALDRAGEMNKRYMAIENHRHFALRIPRALRRQLDFLLPVGPFFDEWGKKIARHPYLSPQEVGEIAEALIDGWQRLEGPIGYARALSGIEQNFPGGLTTLCQHLPSQNAKTLKTGKLRTLISVPQSRFEAQWTQFALKF